MRRGSVLVLVVGVAAITSAMVIAVVARMRAEADENRLVWGDAQARIMLVAACHYVQETSRLGWDDPLTPEHEETCGWIDARDGTPGPKMLGPTGGADDDHPRDRDGRRVYRRGSGAWPDIGGVARCPMDPWTRPPWAVKPIVCTNPIANDPNDPDFGMPYLSHPDPLPAVDDEAAFAAGDPRPRAEAVGLGWFRVLRIAPARFVVTSGAGASRGFRSFQEAADVGEGAAFGDAARFAELVRGEARQWWLIEWSGAFGDGYSALSDEAPEHYRWQPVNGSMGYWQLSQGLERNPVGVIQWIQRLDGPPAEW